MCVFRWRFPANGIRVPVKLPAVSSRQTYHAHYFYGPLYHSNVFEKKNHLAFRHKAEIYCNFVINTPLFPSFFFLTLGKRFPRSGYNEVTREGNFAVSIFHPENMSPRGHFVVITSTFRVIAAPTFFFTYRNFNL